MYRLGVDLVARYIRRVVSQDELSYVLVGAEVRVNGGLITNVLLLEPSISIHLQILSNRVMGLYLVALPCGCANQRIVAPLEDYQA